MAAMTRQEILELLILQAKNNGFEFRKWYRSNLETPWIDFATAVATLARGKRYYALLFSHGFSRNFWKAGAQMTFIVPTSTYTRHNKSGSLITVTRRAYTRRTIKPDAWRYHLRAMAASEDPLIYIRRFIIRHEDVAQFRSGAATQPVDEQESSPEGPAAQP